MIKKIRSIKNFGVFKDFSWSSQLSNFKNFNLIYAWNYSGKTTLSRIFRTFETQKLHEDYPKGQYEMELTDGSLISNMDIENSTVKVKVFNTDYVKSQLKWNEDSPNIEPIFILGEENINYRLNLNVLGKRKSICEKSCKLDQMIFKKSRMH